MIAACAAVLAAALLAAAPTAAARDRGNAVGSWIDVELTQIAAHRTSPPRAARALALMSVAMLGATRAPARRRSAAVGAAAATVLSHLFPDRTAAFEALAARSRSRAGWSLGRAVGERMVARADGDGSGAVWPGAVPIGPGLWVPTPQAFAPPLEPLVGTWRTWNITSGASFRPEPPPAPGGAHAAREAREVFAVSRTLTAGQRRIAERWADGPGTVTPAGHWNRIALELIRAGRLPARAGARVLATLNTAQADAFIACWNAKYQYWTERPVTAIRREIDPDWLPLIDTPPFPSYVSGHSSVSAAAAVVLAAHFPGEARRMHALAREAALSRLYGGIHFRSDNEAGLALGSAIGTAAVLRRRSAR